SAILMEPEIIKNIVVVWLGGSGQNWFNADGFNLDQDLISTRVLLDSGVPLVHLPMWPITSHLIAAVPEVEHHLRGRNALADFLADTFRGDEVAKKWGAKEIWDVAATSYVINPEWVPTVLINSPLLTDTRPKRWATDVSRHLIRDAKYCNRYPIFADLFAKIAGFQDK
ncbi:MAG: nucleoside hydrolase, partial [Puniceicoccaceae bacterium]